MQSLHSKFSGKESKPNTVLLNIAPDILQTHHGNGDEITFTNQFHLQEIKIQF